MKILVYAGQQHDLVMQWTTILTWLTFSLDSRRFYPGAILTDQVGVTDQTEAEVTLVDGAVAVLLTMIAYNAIFDVIRPIFTRSWRHKQVLVHITA